MIRDEAFDVVVLGGGPAGLAAAAASAKAGASTLLLERDEALGGVLRQCVHDGFGLLKFREQLAGPEYAYRAAAEFAASGAAARTGAFVLEIRRDARGGFELAASSKTEGVRRASARALVLATGCRERSDRQVFIHGDRPAGIFTAGLAQYLVNVKGLLPGRRAVILGSGDIGLIMARRLTLEGVDVEGVYEIKAEPSGLARNVRQCLEDFGIPLHLSRTVTAVRGKGRVESVEVAEVDSQGRPVPGTERNVECDCLVLSVGLIPENELAESLGCELDARTRGPRVDQGWATEIEGVYACGNAVAVMDLADYVSESGEAAGRSAADFALASRTAPRKVATPEGGAAQAGARITVKVPDAAPGGPPSPGGPGGALSGRVPIKAGPGFLALVPQEFDPRAARRFPLWFRANATMGRARLVVRAGTETVLERRFESLRPPEMERVMLDGVRVLEALARAGEGASIAAELIREDRDDREDRGEDRP